MLHVIIMLKHYIILKLYFVIILRFYFAYHKLRTSLKFNFESATVCINSIDTTRVTSVSDGNPNFMITFVSRGIEKYRSPIIYILVFWIWLSNGFRSKYEWLDTSRSPDGRKNT